MHDVKAVLRALAVAAALSGAGAGPVLAQAESTAPAATEAPATDSATSGQADTAAEAVTHADPAGERAGDPTVHEPISEDVEHAGEAHESGLPQLNVETFLPQVAWLALTFLVLYLLMSRVALPRVAQVLQDRQERIEGDLQKAEALRAEAQAVEAAYNRALADARAQAAAVLSETQAEITATTTSRQADFLAALAEKTADAEQRIAAERQAALADVATIATEVTRQLVAKVARVEAEPGSVETLVGQVIKERA